MNDEIQRSANWISRSRPILAGILIVAIGFAALLSDPAKGRVQLALTTLFFLNLYWMIVAGTKELGANLSKAFESVESVRRTAAESRTPQVFQRFEAAHDVILQKIDDAIAGQNQLRIQVIAVTGKYSCSFIFDHLPKWAEKMGGGGTVTIEYAIISDNTLVRHEQQGTDWDRHRDLTLRTLSEWSQRRMPPS